jgi:hypothetical protein
MKTIAKRFIPCLSPALDETTRANEKLALWKIIIVWPRNVSV